MLHLFRSGKSEDDGDLVGAAARNDAAHAELRVVLHKLLEERNRSRAPGEEKAE